MYERFTDRARKVMQLANQEAQRFNHEYIGTEHLLLGLIKEGSGDSFEGPHVQNFIECMKSRKKPYCDLETVGHPASVLCHAGNISWRTGQKLRFDAKTETFDTKEANQYVGREHRKGFELPAV